MTQTPEITSKLKEADPTMVDGPSSPGISPAKRLFNVSITDSRISGADEPRAMRVRFATVGFQMATSTLTSFPVSSSTCGAGETELAW